MFDYYDAENAPEASRALMEKSKKIFGMLPNLHKILAGAPITYEAYLSTFDLFLNRGSFSKLEAQVVFMAANVENNCHYCTAGHSMAMQGAQMPGEVICALRAGDAIEDPKLRALQTFTKEPLIRRFPVAPGSAARSRREYRCEQHLPMLAH